MDGYDRHPDDDPDADDEMSAAKAKRGQLWRRVRRTCYVGAMMMVLIPLAAFCYGYFAWAVPDAEKLSQSLQPITVNYANGEELAVVNPKDSKGGSIRSVDEVSQEMVDATLAAEDATFYTNPGFDVMGIARSAFFMFTGSGVGGGSTITQQYIKLDQELLNDPAYVRKMKEIVIAFKITMERDKDDILASYMNTAYYGRGANGIRAAAEAYFGKDPKDLNAQESAVLAGMVQRPTENDPRGGNIEQAQSRFEYVAGQMEESGAVGEGESANMQLPETRERDAWREDQRQTPSENRIQQQVLKELEAKGLDEKMLARGGYTITTSIDPAAQQAADDAVQNVTNGQPEEIRTSLVATDPKTGQVLAYNGGKDVGGFDYADARQPPGSSFKPFVVAAGLQQGEGIGETYDGSPKQEIAGTPFDNAPGSECDPPEERCYVRNAMNESVNTAFVNMANQFGTDKVAEAAYGAGIPRDYGEGKDSLVSSNGRVDAGIALGMYPVRPIDMAGAYGSFLNEGMRTSPHMVTEIKHQDGTVSNPNGDVQPEPAFASSQSESADIAGDVVESMRQVAEESKLPLDNDRPVASKTGTHQWGSTDQNQNAWMVGATPQISTSVAMLAEPEGTSGPLKDADGSVVYGSGLPGEIWQQFMNNYLADKPVEELPEPGQIGQYQNKPPPAPKTTTSEPPPSETSKPSEPPQSETSKPSESETTSEESCGFFGCPEESSTEQEPGDPAGVLPPSRTQDGGN